MDRQSVTAEIFRKMTMIRPHWLLAALSLTPFCAQAEKLTKLTSADHEFCDTVASMAPGWMEQHEQGLTVEEISSATKATVEKAGIDPASDSGMPLIVAADFALISIAQQDPSTSDEAKVIAYNTCGKWIKGRGRVQYKIEDRPMLWD